MGMRCMIGLVLFVVIYFGGCKLLGAVAGAVAANDPRRSQWVAQEAGKKAMAKYHASCVRRRWSSRACGM